MDKEIKLNQIFQGLRSGIIPEKEILELSNNLQDRDVYWMLSVIKGLKGPHEYFGENVEMEDSSDLEAEIIVKGFFQFLDLVSGLIIKLGDSGIAEAQDFDGGNSEYIPWVIRYCSDSRFQREIKENFPFLGI